MKMFVSKIADGDMKIEVKELPVLSLRLQIQLDPYGIKLDTRKFETMIREDNCKHSFVTYFNSLKQKYQLTT